MNTTDRDVDICNRFYHAQGIVMNQTADTVLMIRPACFAFNPETAESNAFQQNISADVQQEALQEFDRAVEQLQQHGLAVILTDDAAAPLPDSVFPNNWFSTHQDGTVIIYPMQSPLRRKEKRWDVFEKILPDAGFRISRITDLSHFEKENFFLEGTGSMVMDHRHKIIYACRSTRTHLVPLQKTASIISYQYCLFDAAINGKEIYHTNVMMAIGNRLAVICPDVIAEDHRKDALNRLSATHELLFITPEQLSRMAGNMLFAMNNKGRQLCILSSTAQASLMPEQLALIEKHADAVVCSIPVIEKTGGGSIRCMMAEIFLPRIAAEK